MDFFREIFQYQFLANALAASVLSGIVCGLVGTYVVCRRLVFLSGGITHSSFGGIGIAVWAAVVAVAGNLCGLWFSYKLDIPAGAATIFVLALTLIVVKLLPLLRGKIRSERA